MVSWYHVQICLLRWIKFEEDFEEDADRLSKPHVVTLSLRSLFELRSCVLRGSVQLDLDAENLCQIVGEFLNYFNVCVPYSTKFWRGKTLTNRSFQSFGEGIDSIYSVPSIYYLWRR